MKVNRLRSLFYFSFCVVLGGFLIYGAGAANASVSAAAQARQSGRRTAEAITPGLPVGVPNPDFWWAIPALERYGLPVILPAWLPYKGPYSYTFNPALYNGMPPINITPLTSRLAYDISGSAHSVGYSIGVGNVGEEGAVPLVGQAIGSNNPPPPAHTTVPLTLSSPYTQSTDGRRTPPFGITVIKLTKPVALFGLSVSIGHGLTARVSWYVSYGTMGSWTTVSFEDHGYLIILHWPHFNDRTAVEIARSLVIARMPSRLQVTFGHDRLTMRPVPGSTPQMAPRPKQGEAWGYRYQVEHLTGNRAAESVPALSPSPKIPHLPTLPTSAVVSGIVSPSMDGVCTRFHTVYGNGRRVVLLPAVLPKPFASFWPIDFQGSGDFRRYWMKASRKGGSASFTLEGSGGRHMPGRGLTVRTKFGPGVLNQTANRATIAFVSYGTTFTVAVDGLGAANRKVALEIVDGLTRVQ